MSSTASAPSRQPLHRDVGRVVMEMFWNDDHYADRSMEDEEIVRMIQLNGMIGFDPELAVVG